MGRNTIRTVDYGELPIAKKSTYLFDEVLASIEDTAGNQYEVRKTFNGVLVALEVEEE